MVGTISKESGFHRQCHLTSEMIWQQEDALGSVNLSKNSPNLAHIWKLLTKKNTFRLTVETVTASKLELSERQNRIRIESIWLIDLGYLTCRIRLPVGLWEGGPLPRPGGWAPLPPGRRARGETLLLGRPWAGRTAGRLTQTQRWPDQTPDPSDPGTSWSQPEKGGPNIYKDTKP